MIIAMKEQEETEEKIRFIAGKRIESVEVPYDFALRIFFDDGTSVEISSQSDVIGDYFEIEASDA